MCYLNNIYKTETCNEEIRESIHIPICIQQDATLHSLYLETALHVSGGISTHHQEHTQLNLQHLVLVRLYWTGLNY